MDKISQIKLGLLLQFMYCNPNNADLYIALKALNYFYDFNRLIHAQRN